MAAQSCPPSPAPHFPESAAPATLAHEDGAHPHAAPHNKLHPIAVGMSPTCPEASVEIETESDESVAPDSTSVELTHSARDSSVLTVSPFTQPASHRSLTDAPNTDVPAIGPNDEARLFVANVPFDTSHEQLAEYFCVIGPVESAQMVVDKHTGKRRGFAFVSFISVEHAQQAVQRLHGATFRGRVLRVARATKPGSGPIENPGWGTMELPPVRTPDAPPLSLTEGHEESLARHDGAQTAAGGCKKKQHAAGAGSARISRKNIPPINMRVLADMHSSAPVVSGSSPSGYYGSTEFGMLKHDASDANMPRHPQASPHSLNSRHSGGQRTPAMDMHSGSTRHFARAQRPDSRRPSTGSQVHSEMSFAMATPRPFTSTPPYTFSPIPFPSMPPFGTTSMATTTLPGMWPLPVEAAYMPTPHDLRAISAYCGASYPVAGAMHMVAVAPTAVPAASAVPTLDGTSRTLVRTHTPSVGPATARYVRDTMTPVSYDSLNFMMANMEQQQQQQAYMQYMYMLQQHMQERAACADAAGTTGMLPATSTAMYAPVHMSAAAPYQAAAPMYMHHEPTGRTLSVAYLPCMIRVSPSSPHGPHPIEYGGAAGGMPPHHMIPGPYPLQATACAASNGQANVPMTPCVVPDATTTTNLMPLGGGNTDSSSPVAAPMS